MIGGGLVDKYKKLFLIRTNSVSVLLICLKHRFEETVDDGYLWLVGEGDKRGSVFELHHGGLLLIEFGPAGQAFSVRIAASLGKVYPVLLHQLAAIVLCAESASVDKYHHGQGFAFLLGRSYLLRVYMI